MKVEKIGLLEFGFVLNEQNVRRIVSTAKEQLDKVTKEKKSVSLDYCVKLENGSVIEEISLDEILLLENHGSIAINEFRFKFTSDDGDHIIQVIYSKTSIDKIKYYIGSSDRDWVFVTMSLIQEKIELTKRKKIFFYNPRDWRYIIVYLGISFIFSFFLMIIYQSYVPDNACYKKYDCHSNYVPYSFVIDKIESEFNNNSDISFTEAILVKENSVKEYKEKLRELSLKNKEDLKKCNDEYLSHVFTIKEQNSIFIYLCLGFTFLTYCYSCFMSKFFPLYVFCWGVEEDIFIKVERQRKFILGTIITGLLISITAGIVLKLL